MGMDPTAERICAAIERTARRIAASGLVIGPGGNISVRWQNTVLITPAGISFESVTKDQMVGVDLSTGAVVHGDLRPSSETRLHLACYRARPDLSCVVHTHPPCAVAVGTTLGRIPPMLAEFPVHIPRLAFLDYITPTTQELADAVAARMTEAETVFLAKHGLVVMGRSLEEAYDRTLIVEESARIYLYARIVGEPRALTDEEVASVVALVRGT